MSLLQLAFTFFYIGLFTIGGGQVAITLMQQSIVSAGLISQEQFYNMIAISESTPGPIGINMATYIGYELYGVPGALAVTGAEVLPSIIIILIIARFMPLERHLRSPSSILSRKLHVAAAHVRFVPEIAIFLGQTACPVLS